MDVRKTFASVLIADAEPYICRVFEARLLRDRRYEVATATSDAAAYRLAVLRPFDLVLWDTRLRGTAETLPAVRALCPDAVVLLTTTDDLPRPLPEAWRLDIAGVLTKPLGLDVLSERIQRALSAVPALPGAAWIGLTSPGQRIVLHSGAGTCTTRVLSCGQDVFAVVGAPRVETPDDFRPGLALQGEIQGADGLYAFHTAVVEFRHQPLPLWELQMPQVIRRNQRRRYPRYPLRRPVALRRSEIALHAEGTLCDIGAGGCTLLLSERLAEGEIVEVTIENSLSGPFLLSARVAQVNSLFMQVPEDALAGNGYRASLAFLSPHVLSEGRLTSLLQDPHM